jgi:hypothetical protein
MRARRSHKSNRGCGRKEDKEGEKIHEERAECGFGRLVFCLICKNSVEYSNK